MDRAFYLDSTPLGLATNPKDDRPEVLMLRQKLRKLSASGSAIFIPAIIEFELKRELLRAGKFGSLRILARMLAEDVHRFIPLTQSALNEAASLWAFQRNAGRPTAPPDALDIDVILAAQVMLHEVSDNMPKVVLTANLSHLSPLVPCLDWRDL